jgi:periplasmic protein TonB
MTPSTHLEAPPETQVPQSHQVQTLVLEPPLPESERSKSTPAPRRQSEDGSFQSSMIESNRMKSGSKGANFAISLLLNLTVLTVPVLAGLYFTDTINLRQFASTFLIAPPPPPPPPPGPAVAAVKAPPVHRVFENSGKLLAPTVIPQKVAQIKEAPLPDDAGLGGVPGGVPGGVAGGSMGGVLGGVIGGARTGIEGPSAPVMKSRAPVRVGGRIREPKLVHRVEPTYPILARQTHMQGTVLIEAVIDEHGNVVEMNVVSGPPLLIQAAVSAVSQWRYEPTYLNDEPVSVAMSVSVTFQLSQ